MTYAESVLRILACTPLILLTSSGVLAQGHATTTTEKTVTYCSVGNPQSFYPGASDNVFSTAAQGPIYNRLVEYEPNGTRLNPGLAESWKVSSDGLTYTLALRKDVPWHSNRLFRPSRSVNADDVIFTLERQWKESHPYFRVASDQHVGFRSMGMDKLLKAIERVDDYTVQITLHRPDATFMADLAMWWAAIQSKEYADAMLAAGTPAMVDNEPIGTGPFSFVQYQKNASIRYKRFDSYFRGPAKVSTLVFKITNGRSAGWVSLKKGECDLLTRVEARDKDDIRATPDITIEEPTELTVGYIAFNTQKKPFDDVRVRKAISMAINKQSIIDGIFFEAGVVAQGPLPPGQWGHRADLPADTFDPAAAKTLLVEAGLPEGFKTDLWYMPEERAYMLEPKRVAELVRSDLQRIGVTVELKTAERQEYTRRLEAGNHQMAMLGWYGDNGDPDNFLGNFFSCPQGKAGPYNIAHFCDSGMETLLQQARSSTDMKHRDALYSQAQTLFKEKSPWLAVSHSVGFKAMRKSVHGYQANALGEIDFSALSIE